MFEFLEKIFEVIALKIQYLNFRPKTLMFRTKQQTVSSKLINGIFAPKVKMIKCYEIRVEKIKVTLPDINNYWLHMRTFTTLRNNQSQSMSIQAEKRRLRKQIYA